MGFLLVSKGEKLLNLTDDFPLFFEGREDKIKLSNALAV